MSSSNQKRDAERRRKIEEARQARKAASTDAGEQKGEEPKDASPAGEGSEPAKDGACDHAGDAGKGQEKPEPKAESKHKPKQKLDRDEKDDLRRAKRKEKQEKRQERRDHPKTALGKKRAESRHKREIAEHNNPKFYEHHKLKVVGSWVLVLLMVLGVSALALSYMFSAATDDTEWEKTGKVAAVVAGTNVMEDSITESIMSLRSSYVDDDGDDSDWAQYLVDNDKTPESLREEYIDSYKDSLLLLKAEKDEGIEVTAQDREDKWDELAENAGGEDALLETVKNQNTSVSEYKQSYDSVIAEQKLKDKVAPKQELTDQDVIDYVNENADTYRGARKSSHILIEVDSEATDEEKATALETANDVISKLNSGELTWEDAVSQYSDDSGSSDDAGDVGWTCDNSFVTEYEDAVKALAEGEMSEPVLSDYGYHIIKCTGAFDFDEEEGCTDISQVPDEIAESIRDDQETEQQDEDYDAWYEEWSAQQEVTINDMPEGLPYDVSLDGVEPSDDSDTSSTSGQVGIVDGEIVSGGDTDSGTTTTTSSDGTVTVTTTTSDVDVTTD